MDDRHVRAGAYVLTVEGRLVAVVDRRVNSLLEGAEALVEDVATPTPGERYLDAMEAAVRPWKWRPCRLASGALVDAAADTAASWMPVGELVGGELVRAPTGMGVTSFSENP